MSRMFTRRPGTSGNGDKPVERVKEEQEEEGDRKRIWLHFVGNGNGGEEGDQQIRVIFSKPLRIAMESYAQRINLNLSRLRFLMDGHRLLPESSAKDYALEDDDLIDVVEWQDGGRC